TRSRIKVADLLRQEGKKDDAMAEYLLAAEELDRQGDVAAVGGVYRWILELDERNVRALSTLGQSLAARGKLAEAIGLAERALQLDDGNTERYEQLSSLFERAKNPAEYERVQRRLAELYRSRGDETRAREILQRFAAVGELGTDEDEIAPGPGDELAGGGMLDDGSGVLFGNEFPDTEGAPELPVDFGSELEIGPGASLSGTPRGHARARGARRRGAARAPRADRGARRVCRRTPSRAARHRRARRRAPDRTGRRAPDRTLARSRARARRPRARRRRRADRRRRAR